jgi:hypothetical protein
MAVSDDMVTRALREFDANAHLSSMHKRMQRSFLAALDFNADPRGFQLFVTALAELVALLRAQAGSDFKAAADASVNVQERK